MPLRISPVKLCLPVLVGLANTGILWSLPAYAQPPSGRSPILAPPPTSEHSKPAPPSLSHPKPGKSVKAKPVQLYPTSAQETADAIIADSLGRIFDKVDDHFHQGEYNHAINLNRIVVQGDPHNVEAYGNAALLLWSSDRNDQAIDFLKRGIQANPKTYYMYDELGAHYWYHLKDPNSAIPYYEQAVALNCPWPTWHGLAQCYEKTKQWDKAVTAWGNAARFPDDKVAPLRLERARQERDKTKG